MGEQFARFGNERRIAVEGGIRFAGGLRCGVVLRRHISHSEPLRFAVHAIERLVAGVGQFQETIGAILNG